METLYICIDESGVPSSGDCFTVAGCWFGSDRDRPQDILVSTSQKLLSKAATLKSLSSPPSELKGKDYDSPTLGRLINQLKQIMYEDDSIRCPSRAWSMSYPLGFTVTMVQPDISATTIDGLANTELAIPEIMKRLALNTVLTPLFLSGLVDLSSYDRVRVLLDAAVWKRAANEFERATESELPTDSEITYSTRNSKATPGIQFADLAAVSWRRNLLTGECSTAAGLLHDLRFAR